MKKPSATPKPIRCAIYTRKSTEEGLEQEFNSLDAQRESAEAFIASQRAEGWVCLPEKYDDGGYSGGNVERPALTRLMADIEAGLVDCVVVYKVDRLSRSLMDFARLMEVFDRRGVSFVSVTQQFNTTHSMGRLTLNILLSFAQFEREIISERTRDKIAAARRRGKWAGGRPVLGYDLVSNPGGGKLIVNDDEAERVRAVFEMYLRLGSMMPVVTECLSRGWTTKVWATKAGKPMGGRALDKGAVFALLTNPVYTGKVRHHEEIYEGEHEAIVEERVFEEVGRRLRANGRTGGSLVRNRHGALLKGLVTCQSCGCSMTHHYATKTKHTGRARYRYYVCASRQKRGRSACKSPMLPAGELERVVLEQIREAVSGSSMVGDIADRARAILAETGSVGVDHDELVGAAEAFEPVWGAMTQDERERLVRGLVERVEWDATEETVRVVFREDVLEIEEAAA